MKKFQTIIYFVVAIATLSYIWWKYSPAVDGTYSFGNEKISWNLIITNGVLKTINLENKITGEKLEPGYGSEDFIFRIGSTNSLGYITARDAKGKEIFPFIIRKGLTVKSSKCLAKWLIKGRKKNTLILEHPESKCRIFLDFIINPDKSWIKRKIRLQAFFGNVLAVDKAEQLNWNLQTEFKNGGRGQPVFLNNSWFAALDHPASSNYFEEGKLILKQFPGYRFEREKLPLQTIVFGACSNGFAKQFFWEYVNNFRRAPRSLSLYNTWCDMRGDKFTSENIYATAEKIKNKLSVHDAKLDCFVVDDCWQNKKSIWKEDFKKNPEGLPDLFEVIKSKGYKSGLWLPFTGVGLDIKWGESQGYESACDVYFCMSGNKFNQTLRKRLKEIIELSEIDLFKHDFNYFDCSRIQHGHFADKMQSSEANVDSLISLLKFESELRSNIFLMVTSGMWPSPFWLKYCDVIWMGGKDHDFDKSFPASCGSIFEMNYRDGALYNIANKNIFPISALMTHGIVDARHNVYNLTAENDEEWANHLMNYLGRGSMLREFYISPERITDKRWRIISCGLKWAKSLDKQMVNSHFILGNPLKGEIFGYKGYADDKSYVSLRNPQLTSTNIYIKDIDFTNKYCEIVYPWHEIIDCNPARSNNAKIHIPPESVVQAESYPGLKCPAPVGVHAKITKSFEDETEYIISYPIGLKSFDVASSVPINSIHGKDIYPEKQNQNLWNVNLVKNEKKSPETKLLSVKINEFGVVNCSVFVPENIETTIQVVYDYGKNASAVASINRKAIVPTTMNGDGWRMAAVDCLPGKNKVFIGLMGINSKTKNIKASVYLKNKVKLSSTTILICHDTIPPIKFDDKPLPIMQNYFCESKKILQKNNVTLSTESALIRGKRVLIESQFSMISSAWVNVDIFDVNGGKYDNKKVFLNGVEIGKLPTSPPPISMWFKTKIQIPPELFNKIKFNNDISILDKTGDAYKIKNLCLEVELIDGKTEKTLVNPAVYSTSLSWELGEGELLNKDGKKITTLSF